MDPTGMAPLDDFVFDEAGEFVEVVETDDPDQIVQVDKDSGEEMGRYDFNDPENDTEAIRDGNITRMKIVNREQVNGAVENSGAPGATLSLLYTYNESIAGQLDFAYDPDVSSENTLHVVEELGVGYNQKDYGNFVWGAAQKSMHHPLWLSKFGAHVNNAIGGAEQNGMDVGFWDSTGDQRAIEAGHRFYRIPSIKTILRFRDGFGSTL